MFVVQAYETRCKKGFFDHGPIDWRSRRSSDVVELTGHDANIKDLTQDLLASMHPPSSIRQVPKP